MADQGGSLSGLRRFAEPPPQVRRRAAVVLLIAALVLALTAGCSKDKKAPIISAPEGFKVVSDDESQFAIAVPIEWELLPLNPKTFNRVAGDIRARNPKLASSLQQARTLADQGGGKLLAIEPDASSSVNLIVADKLKDETFESIPNQSMNQLREAGATDLTKETTTLAGEPAVKVKFKLAVQTDDGPVVTDEAQYYMVRGKKVYILTLAGPSPKLPSVAESLRFS